MVIVYNFSTYDMDYVGGFQIKIKNRSVMSRMWKKKSKLKLNVDRFDVLCFMIIISCTVFFVYYYFNYIEDRPGIIK